MKFSLGAGAVHHRPLFSILLSSKTSEVTLCEKRTARLNPTLRVTGNSRSEPRSGSYRGATRSKGKESN